MKIHHTAGGLALYFERAEGELLVQLLGDTADAMQSGALDADDPVQQRLFPTAYRDDADAEQAFRELTESALRDERIERAERCTAEVAAARTRRRGLEVVLDDEGAERWMRALNDVRLALGTRLEITEDDDHDIDPEDPNAGARMAYGWLTMVQDGLVRALLP
jgi:uncharacterized protein DUF2017